MRRNGDALAEQAPAVDGWLAELVIEVVAAAGGPGDAALTRDLLAGRTAPLESAGDRYLGCRVGVSLWAYYGLEEMKVRRRVLLRMLRANYESPFAKFAITDEDGPMLMTELPTAGWTMTSLNGGWHGWP